MAFQARYNANGIWQDPKWYSQNAFNQIANSNPNNTGPWGLPNCTCYVYGRFWELQNLECTDLPRWNAEDWWNSFPSRYVKSQTPQLGAIMCWYGPGDYRGHVAIVEHIYPNGDVLTSNSGYQRPLSSYPPNMGNYFWTERCVQANGYRSTWEVQRGYVFQGFVYPFQYADGEPVPDPDDPDPYDPTPDKKSGLKVWQMIRRRYINNVRW